MCSPRETEIQGQDGHIYRGRLERKFPVLPRVGQSVSFIERKQNETYDIRASLPIELMRNGNFMRKVDKFQLEPITSDEKPIWRFWELQPIAY